MVFSYVHGEDEIKTVLSIAIGNECIFALRGNGTLARLKMQVSMITRFAIKNMQSPLYVSRSW